MMDNSFNPMVPMLQGQQVHQNMLGAQMQGMSLAERLALKKAAGALGSQNYFAGYEGVPGAERPAALSEAWQNADPAEAAKLEAMYAEPFKLKRAAELVGTAEAAKDAAKYGAFGNFLDNRYGKFGPLPLSGPPTGGQNAMASQLEGVAGTEQAPPADPYAALRNPRPKVTMGITNGSPSYSEQYPDALETAKTIDEMRGRGVTETLAKTKESREAIQASHDNVRRVMDQIKATQQAMQTREVPWEAGQQQIQQLQAELQGFAQQRESLISGQAPAVMPSRSAPSMPPARASAPAAPTASAPRFTEKEQATMDVKNREEQTTATNKEIANARLGVEKVTKFLPQIKELHQLVTSQNIGHPALDSIYGASNVLSLNRSNAQVKKLNEAIINMFAEPGQSQMMNTIVERQMQGAVVPGLFTEPQLNKVNSSILMSNVEHLRNLPTFLEQWQQQHNGALTGAADAWIDYTDHNRKYTYSTDARGLVTVKENTKVMRPEAWQSLREAGKVREVKDKTFVQQHDGSWIEN